MKELNRREFLDKSACGLAIGFTAANSMAQVMSDIETASIATPRPLRKTYRAAAIGSTGHGNFGHGLDKAFRDLPGVELVALADGNPKGLQEAGKRNRVDRLYSDYREMLEKEDLDVVSVAMRYSEAHSDIVVDCANAGKHIYCEKPMAPDLESADRMLETCKKNNVKIAVSMQNRASLQISEALKMVREGRIGKILSLRGRGKEDHRGGGEDLIVLGYHILDLMRLFCGDPQWTFAHVQTEGRDMVRADGHRGTEPNGLVAGDWIASMYGFPNGVHGYFETHRGLKNSKDRFNLEILGSEGMITLRSLRDVMFLEAPVFDPAKSQKWIPITTPKWEKINDKMHWCNQQLILDLLHAAEEDRDPKCSGVDARWSLEMILSVYESHLQRGPVDLPLKNRTHPLLR